MAIGPKSEGLLRNSISNNFVAFNLNYYDNNLASASLKKKPKRWYEDSGDDVGFGKAFAGCIGCPECCIATVLSFIPV